jgi:hypothetical protein
VGVSAIERVGEGQAYAYAYVEWQILILSLRTLDRRRCSDGDGWYVRALSSSLREAMQPRLTDY